jgi:hypothetical protein
VAADRLVRRRPIDTNSSCKLRAVYPAHKSLACNKLSVLTRNEFPKLTAMIVLAGGLLSRLMNTSPKPSSSPAHAHQNTDSQHADHLYQEQENIRASANQLLILAHSPSRRKSIEEIQRPKQLRISYRILP